jgi:hypothetical protein
MEWRVCNVERRRARAIAALSKIIDDLLLLDDCSDTDEWADHVLYLPLR